MNELWQELSGTLTLEIPAYLRGWALVGALAGLGFAVGILTGLFGVGGAFIITPILRVVFGMPYDLVIGSSLSFTVGTSASGLARHMRLRNFEPKGMLLIGTSAVVGAVLGATLNKELKVLFDERTYTLTLHGMFIAVLVVTAWMVLRRPPRERGVRSALQRLRLPPYTDLPTAGVRRISLPGICLVGLLIGVMTGMLGIGGGVLLVPALIAVVGLSAHQAVGTSLGVVVFGSVAGTIKYGMDGRASLLVAMSLLVGSAVGVQFGARMCDRLHSSKLRSYLAALVLMVAVLVAADFARKLITG